MSKTVERPIQFVYLYQLVTPPAQILSSWEISELPVFGVILPDPFKGL